MLSIKPPWNNYVVHLLKEIIGIYFIYFGTLSPKHNKIEKRYKIHVQCKKTQLKKGNKISTNTMEINTMNHNSSETGKSVSCCHITFEDLKHFLLLIYTANKNV